MKNVKHLLKYSLLLALFGCLLTACQKDATRDFEKDIQENTEIDFQQKVTTGDDVQARRPPDNPDPYNKCYNAGVKVDYDCDGSFELGHNDITYTYNACISRVGELIIHYLDEGYCVQMSQGACQEMDCRYQ
ncbi:MAG: hypothetical protein AAFV95_08795 [Bacteroidota bacterium]